MPEFLKLLPPDEARALLLSQIGTPAVKTESVDTASALHRVTAEDILAPHPLPEFTRSSVDGYAVRAQDTYGAADSSPAYLPLAGEVPMGAAPAFDLAAGKAALIHTGGMLPAGSSAVVMLENTQAVRGLANSTKPKSEAGGINDEGPKVGSGLDSGMEIEVLKAAALG